MMKKTILSVAILAAAAAGSAQASINLYDADGVTVDLSGAAEIQYIKQYNSTLDPFLRIDDGDLLIQTSVKVTDQLDAVMGIGFAFESLPGTDTGTTLADELYVGLDSHFGKVTFGRQLFIVDDAGNAKDYELGTMQTNFVTYNGDQVAKWVYDNGGMFYGAVGTSLDNDPDKATRGRGTYDGRIGFRAAGVDARVYYFNAENVLGNTYAPTAVTSQDIQGFNAEIDYAFGGFDISASYGLVTYKDTAAVSTGKNDVTTWQISGGYQANERTYFAVGIDVLNSTAKEAYEKYKGHSIYANATYSLHRNARVYGEVGVADEEIGGIESDLDVGYVVGMEVTF